MHYRKGFSIVELLVVLLLMAVLAAMLFPVFARARTQTRTAICLSNMRSIAQAIRLYAQDYGALFPSEHDRAVIDWFDSYGQSQGHGSDCNRSFLGNPYLRPQVMLDPYLPHRAVWRCPQARVELHALWITPAGRNGWWVNNYVDNLNFRRLGGPCNVGWPSGWGGAITDSFVQGIAGVPDFDPGAFTMSIATTRSLTDLAVNEVASPATYIVAADGAHAYDQWDATFIAYENLCGVQCCPDPGVCRTVDPVNCPWSTSCGMTAEQKQRMLVDARYRVQNTRHFGGSNLGFLDGHAMWYPAQRLLTSVPPYPYPRFQGIVSSWADYAPR